MRLKDQTEEAFSAPNRKSAYLKARAETPEQKGLSYTDLLVDNIIGLDNDYESFGEAFGKAFNEDELGTLKNMAVSAYEGAKEFVTSPIETTKDVATEISDSVSRLGAESLDGRIKRMYGVGYQEATDEQVTKAREAVIGDAITASSLVPAAKGATTVAKAVTPAGITMTPAKFLKRGDKLDSPEVDENLVDSDFEPLDEGTLFPKSNPKESVAGFASDEKLTPEESIAKLKDSYSEEVALYPADTLWGQTATNSLAVLNHFKDKEILDLAKKLPHHEDQRYWNFIETEIKPVAEYIGVNSDDVLSVVSHVSSYLPPKKNPKFTYMTEKPLPERAPLGPRAGEGPERPTDKKAEALGFRDTVYHTSTAPEEFTEFDLAKETKLGRSAQDLLGVHVGTARAAAERNLYVTEDRYTGRVENPQGYTMELRARTTDPVTKEEIAKMFNKKPEELFDNPTGFFSEADVNSMIREYSGLLFPQNELLPNNPNQVAAVNLRRELAREGFTHVPYINDIEDPGSTSLIMLIDRPKNSPAVLRDVRAKFDPKKITEPDLRFAEGGMVEDEQMNRLMQEGGMADDGMSREPVTGNEIPPGSLASEVRDDIPAQLSEGEYVIPADVLRYYGVRFFEDLRAQAKQGMMEMESDGRIGGTPVDAQGVPMEGQDEELTPEEEQMLVEALGSSGMAYVGMVEQPTSTPYQDQATMYQMPAGMGGPMGMQEGGMAFDRTKFTLGDNTSSGIETKRYINPTTKEERTVNFLNGAPLGIIPEGFVPWTQELADQPKPGTGTGGTGTSVPEVKTDRGGSGADRNQPTTGEGSMGWAEKNYDAITADPFDFGMKALTGASENKLGIVGKTAIGGVFNDAGKIAALGSANAALSRLDPNSTEAKALKEGIENLADSLSSPAVSLAYQAGIVGSGKQFTKQLEAYTPSKTPTTSAAAPTTSTISADNKTYGVGYGKGKVDPGLAAAASKDKNKPGGGSTGTSGGTPGGGFGTGGPGNVGSSGNTSGGTPGGGTGTGGPGNVSKDKDKAVGGGQGASNRSGGAFAPGGLVTKPKKITKPKKGLAS
jgi:hypothetical protein